MQANLYVFFFSSRRRHTRLQGDWSSDVCSSDLLPCCRSTVVTGRRSAAETSGTRARTERPRPRRTRWALARQSPGRSEEHTSELQSPCNLVCRLLLEKKKYKIYRISYSYIVRIP